MQNSVSGDAIKVNLSIFSQSGSGATSSYALIAVKMAVVLDQYPKGKLSKEQSKKIQMAVMGKTWKCEPCAASLFWNSYAEKEVVRFSCRNDKSSSW